ncbi:AAA family ATPase [Sphingomonas sp. T1]|uniref:AAA family ATPase n=1 Tax=Sphingomonas sp. T1 TaxID=2653172 RepID=UPI0012EF26F0|nr:AAA family ATPase [Sphingomonas sp. T1]VXD06084.1 AAA family ATPase [Sphingomonas sp. T1]
MRLLRVYIDGYRNLKNVTVDFDKDSLTTVVIGENGSGKSNLIEAIVEVFRFSDLKLPPPSFHFEIEYILRGKHVRISNREGRVHASIVTYEHGPSIRGGEFVTPSSVMPDLIFGYYSGSGRKLEKLFDDHQSRYYGVINKERDDEEYEAAQAARRLFYCRPIHGVLALLSYLAKPGTDGDVRKLLTEKLGITGFHSALAHFKEPSWFNHGNWQKARSRADGVGRGRRTYDTLGEQAMDVWGARGPAGTCARTLRDIAFHPLTMAGKVVDDYRQKPRTEAQLACFLRDKAALQSFAAEFETDQDMFAALEAADISDLLREMIVWVTRKNDDSGDVSFSDLSDGERQLLMVLGLIRVSRGKEALFLLDEPDTHLNPAWQLSYLDLIREWTEVAADEDKCQIIMTTHNPLTIAALTKKEVRVMQKGADDQILVTEPYADPRGLGFTSTLTEIFGLPTTLDPETQKQIDERNRLARLEERSDKQERDLIAINDKLDRLGFMHESRDPLYDDFLKAVQDYKYADRPPMTQDQIEIRRLAMQALIKSLSEDRGKAH